MILICLLIKPPRTMSAAPATAFRPIIDSLDASCRERQHREKPFVTLAYAQSLDGSLTGEVGQPLRLSGSESML